MLRHTGLLALGATILPGGLGAYVWHDVYKNSRAQGQIQVLGFEGIAYINGKPVKKGQKFTTRVSLVLAHNRFQNINSRIRLLLPDFSVLEVNGEARLTMELGTKVSCLYRVESGACTFVIRESSFMYHLLVGVTGLFGLRNGVCHYEVLSADFDDASESGDTITGIPSGSAEYICVCHGNLDCLRNDFKRVFRILGSTYHGAFYTSENGDIFNLSAAPPHINHSDYRIQNMIDVLDPPIYPTDWLRI